MLVGKDAENSMFAVLYCTIFAKFSQILKFFGSRKSQTTGILHTLHHVYRSLWPTRGAKPHFATALDPSAHDWEVTYLWLWKSNDLIINV